MTGENKRRNISDEVARADQALRASAKRGLTGEERAAVEEISIASQSGRTWPKDPHAMIGRDDEAGAPRVHVATTK